MYPKVLKYMSILSMFGMMFSCGVKKKPEAAQSKTSFYELKTTSLSGEPIHFSDFKGKKVMVVNTASECGFTPQYEGLENLHQKHGEDLVIIGFPANDFLGQEPGNNEEIAAFCQKNYGVSFLMSEKMSVKGDNKHPVFQWLTDKNLNGWNSRAPKWNFYKYLVDESGELLAVFPSRTKPEDKKITSMIE